MNPSQGCATLSANFKIDNLGPEQPGNPIELGVGTGFGVLFSRLGLKELPDVVLRPGERVLAGEPLGKPADVEGLLEPRPTPLLQRLPEPIGRQSPEFSFAQPRPKSRAQAVRHHVGSGRRGGFGAPSVAGLPSGPY